MPKYRTPTPDELRNYQSECGYPLRGFVNVSGRDCAVETLGRDDGPRYELIAPDGFHFRDGFDRLHTLLCVDMREVRSARGFELELCGTECHE